ncbi:hypothetical protein CL653_02195 [bacterium]|nr:hypothetical protein [bacterium]
MLVPFYFVIGSTASLLSLILLFRVENKMGKKYFLRARLTLDSAVLDVSRTCYSLTRLFGTGSLRMAGHYLVHTALAIGVAILRKIHFHLDKLQMRHRRVVREVKKERVQSHLEAIQEHKRSVALTEDEKKQLKDKTISGE